MRGARLLLRRAAHAQGVGDRRRGARGPAPPGRKSSVVSEPRDARRECLVAQLPADPVEVLPRAAPLEVGELLLERHVVA